MSASTSMARTQMPKQASKWQLNWKHCNVLASNNGAIVTFVTFLCGTWRGAHKSKEHMKLDGYTITAYKVKSIQVRSTSQASLLPFHAADHVTMLCKVMFPDSKTAAQWCLLQAEPRQLSLLSVLLYQHLMLKYLKSASLHLLHFCVMVVMTKWARSILESWCDIGVKWHISQ